MRRVIACVACGLAAVDPAPGQPNLQSRLDALASAHPGMVEVSSIGLSRQGRPVRLVTLGHRAGGADARPALLIIAGVNPMHRVGVEAALAVAEGIARDHADRLATNTVYVLPLLNPDGFAWHAEPGRPAADFPRAPRAGDADRDGRVSEDGAEDLNGDGVVTMMRQADPPPGSPWRATLCDDPENPGLMKTPDPAKGEAPKYAVFIEGIDNDGDGRFNEDGPGGSAGGGVDFDLNAPYRWKEWGDGIGDYPFSEPETRALAAWMHTRTNIAAVLVFGPHDTLVNIPPAGRFDDSGQVPLGIEEGDKVFYEEISRSFKEITKMTGAPSTDNAGSIQGWCYAHYAAWTFATPVWVRPDLVKADEGKPGEPAKDEKKDEPGGADRPREEQPAPGARGGGRPGGQPGGPTPGGGRRFGAGGGPIPPPAAIKASDPDDAKWLRYSTEKRGGEGFIPWTTFNHPQLGTVELGGFRPGFRLNPPDDELPRLGREQTKFAVDLLGRLPNVALDAPVVTRVGPSLWRVAARARNTGYLPSMPAIGVKARRSPPTLMTLDVPMSRLVSGSKTVRAWAIPGSGGSADAEWVVTGEENTTVPLKFSSSLGLERTVEVTLREGDR